LPLLAKDVIKEQLADALGLVAPDPLTSSTRLGAAAMEVLWRLAADHPAAVLEANFRPRSTYERDRILALCPSPVEVHCSCPPDVALRRFIDRAATSARHAVHVRQVRTVEDLAEFAGPIGLGPVVQVDTTAPIVLADVVARVRAQLP
jgi:hypothetical protein